MVVTKSPVEATLTFPQPMMSVNSVPDWNAPFIGMVTVYFCPFWPVLLSTMRTSFFKKATVSKSVKRTCDNVVT